MPRIVAPWSLRNWLASCARPRDSLMCSRRLFAADDEIRAAFVLVRWRREKPPCRVTSTSLIIGDVEFGEAVECLFFFPRRLRLGAKSTQGVFGPAASVL